MKQNVPVGTDALLNCPSNKSKTYFFGLFIALSLGAFLKVVFVDQISGHYQIFNDSARLLWQGKNPYNIFHPLGFYFYSQSCGLFFYSLFAYLPYKFGVALYIFMSWCVFTSGALYLLRALKTTPLVRNAFWVLVSSEVIGNMLNTRLELIIEGLILWSLFLLLTRQYMWLCGLMLALATNWKLQALPTVGLLAAVSYSLERRFTFASWWLVFMGVLAFAPLFVLSWELFQTQNADWASSLHHYMTEGDNWLHFQQVFAMLYRTTGIKTPLQVAQLLSACVGVAMLTILLSWLKSTQNYKKAIGVAGALGAAFVVCLSPLSQSAGFILYAPLLLSTLIIFDRSAGSRRKKWLAVVATGYFFTSFLYSDFVPVGARLWIFEHSLKPLGALVMGCALIIHLVRERLSFQKASH